MGHLRPTFDKLHILWRHFNSLTTRIGITKLACFDIKGQFIRTTDIEFPEDLLERWRGR